MLFIVFLCLDTEKSLFLKKFFCCLLFFSVEFLCVEVEK